MNAMSSSEWWKRSNVGKKLGESQANQRTNTSISESIENMPLDDNHRSNVFVIGMDWLDIVIKPSF